MHEYIVGGQKIELTDGGNIKLHIESIFKSAGIMYHFPNKCAGIGINENIVDIAIIEERDIIISIGDSKRIYWIRPSRIQEIIEQYRSIYTLPTGMRLYVVPLNELNPIGN